MNDKEVVQEYYSTNSKYNFFFQIAITQLIPACQGVSKGEGCIPSRKKWHLGDSRMKPEFLGQGWPKDV